MHDVIDMPFGTIEVISTIKSFDVHSILLSYNYKNIFSKQKYIVYMGYDFKDTDTSYRAKQMSKGIYLGHNIGDSAKIRIIQNEIWIYTLAHNSYEQIFWSFVIKYIFTKAGIENNVLHIKGTLIRSPKNKNILLLGKTESGKTTLANKLQSYGFKLISNTHCFISNRYVWGVGTWIRTRVENGDDNYITPSFNISYDLEGGLAKILIINHNKKGLFKHDDLDNDSTYYFIKNYAAAITNYDIKEEIWDYFTQKSADLSSRLEPFKKEDLMIRKLCKDYNISHLSMDVHNEALFSLLIEFVESY